MSQASTVRATAPGQGRPRDRPRSYRLRCALLGATAVLLLGAGSASAQQYGSVGASVTVDYGVLDSLGGAGGPNLPAMLSQGGYPQQSPYAASPYAAPYAPVQGQLLAPPSTAPRSTMTAAPMDGAAPGQPAAAGGEVIRLIPPSQIKKSAPAVAAAPAPTPAPTPQPAAQPAATPPPPPTEIAETPAATPPAPPPPPAAPAPAAPAAADSPPSAPEPTQQAAATPPPPAPEPPAAPEPAAEPAPAAAAEPEPAPAPAPATENGSGMSAGDALTETGLAEAAEAPEQSLAEAEPVTAASEPAAPAPTDSGAASGADAASQEDTQTAALPPQSAVEGQVSIGFAEGASELTPEAKSSLDVLAERLRGDESLRVQLLAYAVAVDDNTSRARRMSLSRALAVRAYLIEKGVRSTRMDVRALGSNADGEPADKVDIIPQAQ